MTNKYLALIVVALLALAILPAGAQSAPKHVNFPSLDKALAAPLSATLYRPAGNGPFPALVLMPGCSGTEKFHQDWAAWLVHQGYAALLVDSFAPRHVQNVCVGGAPTELTRSLDAFGAPALLRTRSDIDPKKIGLIGWSHGAGAAYIADAKARVDAAVLPGGAFRAVVALYPYCDIGIKYTVAPILFLDGSADDWTPAPRCQLDADALSSAGRPVEIHVYPGATHGFDNPADNGIVHVGSDVHNLMYDAGAANDAHSRVAAFLTANMN